MFAPARIPAIVLVALVLCVAPAHATRTYKWVDEDGVTHYSQYPPPEGEAQIIEPSIGVPSGTTGAEGSSDGTGGDGDEADTTAEGPTTMEAYCKQLREQAQMLASDRDVRVRQEDGSLKPLAGDARAQKRAEVARQIDRNC